jgi:hypothetical protein
MLYMGRTLQRYKSYRSYQIIHIYIYHLNGMKQQFSVDMSFLRVSFVWFLNKENPSRKGHEWSLHAWQGVKKVKGMKLSLSPPWSYTGAVEV